MKKIREVVTSFGKDILGFTATEVGTHSIRSSTVIHLVLANKHTYIIMLLGRWTSDSFLRYIREQVQEFSRGISTEMTNQADFFTTPSIQSPHQTIDIYDPRLHSRDSYASSLSLSGPDSHRGHMYTQEAFAHLFRNRSPHQSPLRTSHHR